MVLEYSLVIIAERADRFQRERCIDEVRRRMGNPRFEVFGMESQIAFNEEKFARKVIAIIMGGHNDGCCSTRR